MPYNPIPTMICEEPHWWPRAACRTGRNYLLFFPPIRPRETKLERLDREKSAIKICWSCPVQGECQAYSVEKKPEDGIWGGMTASEIRTLAYEMEARAYRKAS